VAAKRPAAPAPMMSTSQEAGRGSMLVGQASACQKEDRL
jgi:hypothetical protein